MKPCPQNARIKLAYTRYLREARRKSEPSIDAALAALAAIDRFERHARRDFRLFHIRQAISFKEALARETNPRTKAPLSTATRLQILSALHAFFTWLADQHGYRRGIRYPDADYFSLSLKETAIAKASRDTAGPTIEQVRHVLGTMPADSDIERRNRALIAFTLLTGARDNAIASLRLKHVDVERGEVDQDAREVRTKASKSMVTWFFPVGDDIRAIVADWIGLLVRERHWGPDDPLFPATRIARGESGGFTPIGLARRCWSTAEPIRSIFRDAFTAAGLPYFNPHSLRKTLARFGEQRCSTPEEFKAWSQNLGHEKVLTTFTSYGAVDRQRQAEIMRALGRPTPEQTAYDGDAVAAALKVLDAALGAPRSAL